MTPGGSFGPARACKRLAIALPTLSGTPRRS